MKTMGTKFLTIFLATLIVAGSFGLGFYTGSERSGGYTIPVEGMTGDISQTVDFAPFWEAWRILDQNFVNAGSTTPQERVWGAIQGLASSYGDQYTTFLPPEDTKIFNETISGNFGGVGMEIGLRENTITVIAPLKNTPASRAGIRAGDHIISINDVQTKDLSLEGAVQHIRGEVGTKVMLTVFRPDSGASMTFDIVRAVIQIPTIDTTLRPDGIFVINIYNFSALAHQFFQSALREFAESGSSKLIIDLRGNPGGFLSAAIDMTSWFLPVGKVVVREQFGDGRDEEVQRSRGYDVFTDAVSIVILIDGGSASASEIFAGALQEHGKATLIGSQTFGKGSVQELIPLTGDTTLKVTVAKWLTPNGISISDGGLTPDIVVDMTAEDFEKGRDPQLAKAVEILLAK